MPDLEKCLFLTDELAMELTALVCRRTCSSSSARTR